jgi:hypothetical protein
MTPANSRAPGPAAVCNDFVSSDFLALASHMNACHRSRGRLFMLRSSLESLHALASPRIVTTGAALVACGLLGLLALA